MSETMTASERARELVTRAVNQASREAWAEAIGSEGRPEWEPDARAALLAYVARLEACVDAARAITDLERHPRLAASLAALDRPEDGQ